MRNPYIVAAFLTILFAGAYIVGQTGSSMTISNSTACPSPAKGIFAICKPTAGGVSQWTDEGSPYAPWPPSGTPGPQGPIGLTGLTGPQGPAGTMAGSFSCTTMAITSSGVSFSGCK